MLRGIMKILVTDDDPDGADVTKILLERQGHHVAIAHNGPETIKQASADTPDMVLLDINLPGMDGYQVCVELRKNSALKNTPIFAYTGIETPEVTAAAKATGFTGILEKSSDFTNVRDKIASLAAEQNSGASSTAAQEEPQAQQITVEKKKEDIGKIVHDLRGPLSTLQNCLEIIETGFKKPEEVMPHMRRSVDAMAKVVERLRDINQE
jgi:CheY-like chemotaxis protein